MSGLPNNAMSPSGGQMRLSTPRSTLDHNIVLSRGTLVSLLSLLLQFLERLQKLGLNVHIRQSKMINFKKLGNCDRGSIVGKDTIYL